MQFRTFPIFYIWLGTRQRAVRAREEAHLHLTVKQLVTIGLSGRVSTPSDDSAKHSKSRYLFYYMVKIGVSGSLLQRL